MPPDSLSVDADEGGRLLALLHGRLKGTWTREEICLSIWPGRRVTEDEFEAAVASAEARLAKEPSRWLRLERSGAFGLRLRSVPRAKPPSVWPARIARWMPRPQYVAGGLLAGALVTVTLAGAVLQPSVPNVQTDAATIVAQAEDHYYQYDYAANEKAIVQYQRAIRLDPKQSRAFSGLANALVQRVMRWPMGAGPDVKTFSRLEDALRAGIVEQPQSQAVLRRAMRMADKAVALNPRDAAAHKAQALVLSAQRKFQGALSGYKRAVGLDRDAWGPMINIGEILEIEGRTAEAMPYYERAYEAMARDPSLQSGRAKPWHSDLGIHIGDAYRARGELKQSAQWYRKVLDQAPMHPLAAGRLAQVLQAAGDERAAKAICEALKSKLGAAAADCRS
jgi:transcriptional activator of cad operon